VERKTHRESWKGEESVKERFYEKLEYEVRCRAGRGAPSPDDTI